MGLTVAVAIGLLLATGSCSADHDPHPPRPRAGSAVVRASVHEAIHANFLGVIDIVSVESFDVVDGPLTLTVARPISIPPQVELLAAKINFASSARYGKSKAGMAPGALCTQRWPPQTFVDQFAPEGLQLEVGDSFFLTFYTRPRVLGTFEIRGIHLEYKLGGRDYVQTDPEPRITSIRVRDPGDVPGGHRITCNPRSASRYRWITY